VVRGGARPYRSVSNVARTVSLVATDFKARLRSDLSGALKGGSRTTETASRAVFRQALVALQVAMSVVLLAAAALLGRSLLQLRAVDPGFDPTHLLSAQLQLVGDAYATPAARVRFFDGLLKDIRALPGVDPIVALRAE